MNQTYALQKFSSQILSTDLYKFIVTLMAYVAFLPYVGILVSDKKMIKPYEWRGVFCT